MGAGPIRLSDIRLALRDHLSADGDTLMSRRIQWDIDDVAIYCKNVQVIDEVSLTCRPEQGRLEDIQ